MLFDEDARILTVNAEWTERTGWTPGEAATLADWAQVACDGGADQVLAQLGDVIAARAERARLEAGIATRAGALLTWEMVASPVGAGTDGRRLFVCVAHDVTERAQAERTRQLLIGELNHRVKNNLTTVLAIARQTLRQTRNPDAFTASFTGRIQALARAHALLSETTWRGADLHDLVQEQLALGVAAADRVQVSGPPALLAPQVALQAALMLHELFTNAAKYGALSQSEGRVHLDWDVADGRLRLRWRERGGPPVVPNGRRGFGTLMIERGTASFGGSAAMHPDPSGMRWDVVLPLARAGHAAPQPDDVEGRPLVRWATADGRAAGYAAGSPLARRRILVVEDEPLLALEFLVMLEGAGAAAIGPAATVEEALRLVEATPGLDAVLLDGNLGGQPVDAVARALARRGLPFAFVTGYGRDSLPGGFETVPILSKPVTADQLLDIAALIRKR